MKKRGNPDVFTYRNYRTFLRDYYDFRKSSEYGFSYRRFARTAGLASPNYLKLVTEGARNLTAEMAGRFAAACGLDDEAAHYFCDLVAFNQAAGEAERDRCHARLRGYRRYRQVYKLDAAHAAYHSEWYIPVVRELASCKGFRSESRWIARRLRPPIAARDATRALKVLQQLGMLNKDADGNLVQSESLVTTGEGPLGHHIVRFHHTMLERAQHALDHVPTEERGFGALTLAIDGDRFEQIKQQLYEFRQHLLQESAAQDRDPDTVVQVNFQIFPLTHRRTRDAK